MMMGRVPRRACFCLLLCASGLVYSGCTRSDPPPPGPAASSPPSKPDTTGSTTAHTSKSRQPLADWPTPRAVLVVTGEMDGYLEPCGCTQGQVGGLIRRSDFIDGLKAKNWPLALIDLGTLIKDPTAVLGGFEQAKMKFQIALKAYSALKYNAIALSAEDLKVGIGEALAQFLNSLGETTKIVVANVQTVPGFESRIQASQIIADGPVKLGVTAVIDPSRLEKLTDPKSGEADLLPSIKKPDEVLGKVLADLESRSDYQVLMVQGAQELAKRLAAAFPGFDLIVASAPSADPLKSDPVMLNDGKTMLLDVGRRGKYVGVVGFFTDRARQMRFSLVGLNSHDERPDSPMKKIIRDEYRNMLKDAGVVENFPKHGFTGGSPGATFVGAETCKRCHPNTYSHWASSKHARAFESLEHDPKPNAIHDAECITCHTVGFEYTSGYRSAAATPQLKGTQCENCHGPASKHVSAPDSLEFRKPLRVTEQQAEKGDVCNRCHDEDNSPKFDFATYWPQVRHNGMDEYTDPKVHKGITPKVARKTESSADK
ncbi:MAG: multiheme c-type cytochrome [Isosphaeraceae bacterium]